LLGLARGLEGRPEVVPRANVGAAGRAGMVPRGERAGRERRDDDPPPLLALAHRGIEPRQAPPLVARAWERSQLLRVAGVVRHVDPLVRVGREVVEEIWLAEAADELERPAD